MVQYLDRPPAGWFVLDVKRLAPRAWVAVLMDVDPHDMQDSFCEFPARSYVQPKDYSLGTRVARANAGFSSQVNTEAGMLR